MKTFLIISILLLTGMFTSLNVATSIFINDKQLNDLLDPNKKIDLSTGIVSGEFTVPTYSICPIIFDNDITAIWKTFGHIICGSRNESEYMKYLTGINFFTNPI